MPPTQEFDLFKQISVPHGNSVLACGSFTSQSGAPTIGPPPQVLPSGINTDAYDTLSVGNLNPDRALNPNLPLSQALAATQSQPTSFIELEVDSAKWRRRGDQYRLRAAALRRHADIMRPIGWRPSADRTNYTQLQYSQTIMMRFRSSCWDRAGRHVVFPHITANTLTKVPGSGPAG